MHQIITGIIMAVFIMAFFGMKAAGSVPGSGAGGGEGQPASSTSEVSAESKARREALAEKLKKLAETPPPKDLKPGAMCYDTCMRTETAVFKCDSCQSTGEISAETADEIAAAKRTAAAIKARGVAIKLDASGYCKKCGPASVTPGRLSAVVEKTDGEKILNCVKLFDLEVVLAFLDGKDRIGIGQGREAALRDYVPSIEKILGINAK